MKHLHFCTLAVTFGIEISSKTTRSGEASEVYSSRLFFKVISEHLCHCEPKTCRRTQSSYRGVVTQGVTWSKECVNQEFYYGFNVRQSVRSANYQLNGVGFTISYDGGPLRRRVLLQLRLDKGKRWGDTRNVWSAWKACRDMQSSLLVVLPSSPLQT